jgi:diketogulonate reductase-like aldo/keto reductase
MRLIDTAELYGDGRSESMISRVIAGQRDRVFLVSKVLPNHTSGDGIVRACEGSLARLGTNYLDPYLLHWRNADTDLSRMVAAFEGLRATGKIRAWGVSNFKVIDMEDLLRVPDGHRCATNQVRYSLDNRRIEYDLLPLVRTPRHAGDGLHPAWRWPGARSLACSYRSSTQLLGQCSRPRVDYSRRQRYRNH